MNMYSNICSSMCSNLDDSIHISHNNLNKIMSLCCSNSIFLDKIHLLTHSHTRTHDRFSQGKITWLSFLSLEFYFWIQFFHIPLVSRRLGIEMTQIRTTLKTYCLNLHPKWKSKSLLTGNRNIFYFYLFLFFFFAKSDYAIVSKMGESMVNLEIFASKSNGLNRKCWK